MPAIVELTYGSPHRDQFDPCSTSLIKRSASFIRQKGPFRELGHFSGRKAPPRSTARWTIHVLRTIALAGHHTHLYQGLTPIALWHRPGERLLGPGSGLNV